MRFPRRGWLEADLGIESPVPWLPLGGVAALILVAVAVAVAALAGGQEQSKGRR